MGHIKATKRVLETEGGKDFERRANLLGHIKATKTDLETEEGEKRETFHVL